MGWVRFLALAFAFSLGSLFVGWWTVPLVGFAWGLVGGPFVRPGLLGAAGAALSWALLLAWATTRGPVWHLTTQVGAVLGIPGWALVIVAIAFAALLGGTAATLGASLRPRRREPDVGRA